MRSLPRRRRSYSVSATSLLCGRGCPRARLVYPHCHRERSEGPTYFASANHRSVASLKMKPQPKERAASCCEAELRSAWTGGAPVPTLVPRALLHHLRSPQIMEVHDAPHAPSVVHVVVQIAVHDDERRNFHLFHAGERGGCELLRANGF